MFKLNQNANTSGTHRVGTIHLKPRDIIKAFGFPQNSDGYKVSGEYIFTDEIGEVFTLYDYKMTSLYDPEYINPVDFWALETPQEFSIGGNTTPLNFLDWLENKVESWRSVRVSVI